VKWGCPGVGCGWVGNASELGCMEIRCTRKGHAAAQRTDRNIDIKYTFKPLRPGLKTPISCIHRSRRFDIKLALAPAWNLLFTDQPGHL
jgi:hypothetical protein